MPSKRTKTVGVVIHHTAGNETSANALRASFKRNFDVDYIGYHRAIAPNGEVWYDLNLNDVGVHNNGGRLNNTNSIGIALVGNFEQTEPTKEQLNVLVSLLRETVRTYGIKKEDVVGHRDMKATACPGKNLYSKLPYLIDEAYNDMKDVKENIRVSFRVEGYEDVFVTYKVPNPKHAEELELGDLSQLPIIPRWPVIDNSDAVQLSRELFKTEQERLKAENSAKHERAEREKLLANHEIVLDELEACQNREVEDETVGSLFSKLIRKIFGG